jgi:hypothetical protein
MSKVRSAQLKRDQRNGFRSRLHRHAIGRGCTLRFYRYGFANPVESGVEPRRRPCTRERLYHLVLSTSQVVQFENEWIDLVPKRSGSKSGVAVF